MQRQGRLSGAHSAWLWPGPHLKEHIAEVRYRIGPVNVMDPRLRRLFIDKNPIAFHRSTYDPETGREHPDRYMSDSFRSLPKSIPTFRQVLFKYFTHSGTYLFVSRLPFLHPIQIQGILQRMPCGKNIHLGKSHTFFPAFLHTAHPGRTGPCLPIASAVIDLTEMTDLIGKLYFSTGITACSWTPASLHSSKIVSRLSIPCSLLSSAGHLTDTKINCYYKSLSLYFCR